ncbi:MAG: tRNA preQ1(34) S-adenosylmethionine ribosyltransferase-isomerase QueA [Gemmatimonadota bacterium]
MKTSDFDYRLPPELVAQTPAERRDGSRMLVVGRGVGSGEWYLAVRHLTFRDFPSLVEPGDVVVINDSRVIPARLLAKRRGGGEAEVLLVARQDDGTWRALVRPGARIKPSAMLSLGGGDAIEVVERLAEGERLVRLVGNGGDDGVIARHGRVPLPPYIAREPTDLDRERYQTVYADAPGSVAAPTAGLHFTPETLDALQVRGATVSRLTLHVGPGTFRPVTADDPAQHHLDAEAYVLPEATAKAVNAARAAGRRVWAVGTTAVRTLEANAQSDGAVTPGAGWTSLFIRPGHTFRAVDRLLTNFHLPRSTLLMLVCAFAGRERVLAAYAEAVRERYRFYSYGDAMAIL